MASLGLPGLAGFWGEFPVLLSSYSPRFNEEIFRVYLVVAAIGTVFAAAYLLWMFQRTLLAGARLCGNGPAWAADGPGLRLT